MGDFLLDLRENETRLHSTSIAENELRWFPDTRLERVEAENYSLLISRSDAKELWAPAICYLGAPGRQIAALAGRVALESGEWESASNSTAIGGLACRSILDLYRAEGIEALERLNGNFAVVIIDEPAGRCHIVTDPSGTLLCYATSPTDQALVIGSHPDVLASAVSSKQELNLASVSEFVGRGMLTFPYTYYKSIEALNWATVYSFESRGGGWRPARPRTYFSLQRRFDKSDTTSDLADGLAETFRNAVQLRSLPVLGKTAVAMSGGMDSRALLSCTCTASREHAVGFSMIDEENLESRVANSITTALGVPFHLIKRPFDYYGSAAEAGVRIGGAMGSLASNHFLGIRQWLREEGVENLLTGCYCDYLFKALALNTEESRWLRRERMCGVNAEFYRPLYLDALKDREAVESRMQSSISEFAKTAELSDCDWFEIESRRIFPLASEGDCAQRVITQRVLPWFSPFADRGVLEMYARIPPSMKLNGGLFKQMLRRVCPAEVLRLPNSNTGAPVLATGLVHAFYRYRSALLDRWKKRFSNSNALRGSWPNWHFYFRNSKLVNEQWNRYCRNGVDVLAEVVEPDVLNQPVSAFSRNEPELFARIWTLKLWLQQRFMSN